MYYADVIHHLLAHPDQQITTQYQVKNPWSSTTTGALPTTMYLNVHNNNIKLPLYAPSIAPDIRSNLMEGKNSILQNLTTPTSVYDGK